MLAYIFIGLAVLFVAVYLVTRKKVTKDVAVKVEQKREEKVQEKVSYGEVTIFYGSQTGTSAKLSEQLAEEATEQGFVPEVVDLKNVDIEHFEVVMNLCRGPTNYRYLCYRIQEKETRPITQSDS
jgi:sulfite reductase alpha subunit-like flavoprotein